jgi:hypothetical protein
MRWRIVTRTFSGSQRVSHRDRVLAVVLTIDRIGQIHVVYFL